jgi:hypothetical protein
MLLKPSRPSQRKEYEKPYPNPPGQGRCPSWDIPIPKHERFPFPSAEPDRGLLESRQGEQQHPWGNYDGEKQNQGSKRSDPRNEQIFKVNIILSTRAFTVLHVCPKPDSDRETGSKPYPGKGGKETPQKAKASSRKAGI